MFVAHYAISDLRALKLEYERIGRTMPAMLVLDTYQVAHLLNVQTDGGGYGLRALLAHWGRTPIKHHDALADAQDTRFLLDKLLRLASQQGHNNVDLLIAAASPNRQTTEDYNAGDPGRSEEGNGPRFTHIDRPASHIKAHRKLPANATAAQVTSWLTTTRACIDLRCPQMLTQIADLKARPDQYDRILRALMTDLGRASRAGQVVQANTILLAYTAVLSASVRVRGRKSLAHEKYVIATHKKLTKHVTTRCPTDPATRSDACTGCRSRQGCAHDTWEIPFGALSIVASYKKDALTKWLGQDGLLTRSARSNARLAALQADFVIDQLEDRDGLGAGTALAQEAVALALYTPTVGRIVAQHHALAGDISAALVDVETFLSLREGNTAPAWDLLEDYRHTLHAQAAQAKRVAPKRPYRAGHTAPKRPTNRRFTSPRQPVATTPTRPLTESEDPPVGGAAEVFGVPLAVAVS